MKLYIASRSQEKAAALRVALMKDGHCITARWITEDKKFSTGVANYTDAERTAIALMDEEDVRRAIDGLILIAEPEGINVPGGKHVETGIAIALSRKVFVIGRRENIFHWHPLVTVYPNEEALRLRLLAVQPAADPKAIL